MTDGHCTVCGESYTKRGMTRHLTSCLGDLPTTDGSSLVHLRVIATHRPDYWLHLAVKEMTTLDALDGFVCDLWLECCGHMSAFTIGDIEYTKPYTEGETTAMAGVDRRPMDVALSSVVETTATDQDREFMHEYDFGTTTELTVRVVDAGGWDLPGANLHNVVGNVPQRDGVYVLARNEPPEIECGECGSPATVVCQRCLHRIGPDAWLCDDCADAHESECEFPSFLPRINSPRTGVCGYTG